MDLTETAVFRISAKHVDRLFRVSPVDCVASAVAAVAVLAAISLTAGDPPLLVLFCLPLLLALIRWLLAFTYNRESRPGAAVKRWGWTFNVSALIAGLWWGASAAFLLRTDFALAAYTALGVAVAMSIAGVVWYAGSRAMTISFAALALAPAAASAALRGDTAGAVACGAAVVGFIVALLAARITHGLVWEAAMSTAECEQLAGHLDQRRTQVEKLNVALKTNADKREQAEIALRRTAADLGLVQGKAKALADTLERISPVCQVTGLANRRHFNEQLDAEWRRAAREQKPVSLVVVEIDEFTEYVESYGAQSSDSLLKRVGQTTKGFGRRSGDLAGRYDDEKLALMLPGCDARNAARMAEALRKRIEKTKIAHAGAKNRDNLTVHVGVATIKPARGLSQEELQKRADAALYEARFQGGNKIVVYQPLSKLKLERWNKPNDGPLSEQSLTQKLLVWGYDTAKDILNPDESPTIHVSPHDTVIAILTGELLIDVEGHTMAIKAGDSIFVPNDVQLSLQAVGDHPVVKFTATKSD